jgi:hypothetical protein
VYIDQFLYKLQYKPNAMQPHYLLSGIGQDTGPVWDHLNGLWDDTRVFVYIVNRYYAGANGDQHERKLVLMFFGRAVKARIWGDGELDL